MVFPLALGFPGGPGEWIIIGALGLLIFGKRLPEVGRSLGKGIVEFKKGLKGIEDDIETGLVGAGESTARADQIAAAPHKFDPYTGKPLDATRRRQRRRPEVTDPQCSGGR